MKMHLNTCANEGEKADPEHTPNFKQIEDYLKENVALKAITVIGDVCNVWGKNEGDTWTNFDITSEAKGKKRVHVFVNGDVAVSINTRVKIKGDLTAYGAGIQMKVWRAEDVVCLQEEKTEFEKRIAAYKMKYPTGQKTREITLAKRRIGVISSGETDAGYMDFMHAMNPDKMGIQVEKKFGIMTAYNMQKHLRDLDGKVDCIAIVRGGGTRYFDFLEFYHNDLMQAIYDSNTPVAVGIGHKGDELPCYEFADIKAITPTAVGSALRKKLHKGNAYTSLKEENRALKQRIEKLQEENRMLKEKQNKTGFFAWLGRCLKSLTR